MIACLKGVSEEGLSFNGNVSIINTSLKLIIKMLTVKANFNLRRYQVHIAKSYIKSYLKSYFKSFSNPSDSASKLSFPKIYFFRFCSHRQRIFLYLVFRSNHI